MGLEEKVLSYRKITEEINDLEIRKKILTTEILLLMTQNEEKIETQNLKVKRHSRLNIKTPIETARSFGATKSGEIVDKDQIKKLISQGILIDGVTESTYIIVSKLSR